VIVSSGALSFRRVRGYGTWVSSTDRGDVSAGAFLRRPLPYAAWWGFVVAASVATWFVDPYVFGFTVLGLAGASAVVALIGFVVWLVARPMPHAVAVLSALIVASSAAALFAALLVNWRC
jgi:hypothetical protein